MELNKVYNSDALSFMKSDDFRNIAETRKIIIVTDPPFNVGYHYSEYKDNFSDEQYYGYLQKLLSLYKVGFVIIHYPESLYKLSSVLGIIPARVISWVYNSNTARQHRDIAFFRINPCFAQVRQPYKNLNDKRIQHRIDEGKTGARIYDWWKIDQIKNVQKDRNGLSHPCIMPEEVMDNVIGILPKEKGMIVYDPFAGSGTTLISCKKLGIDFIGTDIDKGYTDLANIRLGEDIKKENKKDLGQMSLF